MRFLPWFNVLLALICALMDHFVCIEEHASASSSIVFSHLVPWEVMGFFSICEF